MTSAEDGLMTLLEAMLQLAAREARRPKPPPVKPGGYPEDAFVDLSDEEREAFTCNICYQVLKETMQCVNEHKFCHSCLLVWSTTGVYANRITCPVCRTQGYYFRDTDLDDKIAEKKVKCHLDSCQWTGKCKHLLSHRHTTYDDEKPGSGGASGGSDVVSMPRLTQATPQVPATGATRFMGTGLTTRTRNTESMRDYPTPRSLASLRQPLDSPGPPRQVTDTPLSFSRQSADTPSALSMQTADTPLSLSRQTEDTPGSLSSTSQETIVEIPQTSGASQRPLLGQRRVPPVRTANRIVFNHSGPNRDGNNNVSGATANRPIDLATSESNESLSSSINGGFAPRPPSAPRSSANTVNVRRLPRITNPPPPRGRPRPQASEASSSGGSTSTFQPPASTENNLGQIRDRLQESRHRLDNLMSSFAGEVDRNRQEMADFQQERERARREQLDEVRELGQRLGQVAGELRRLLENRRHQTIFSDDDDDEE